MGLEILSHQVQNSSEDRIAQGIKDLVAVLPRGHELFRAQHGQVLRNVSLLEMQSLMKSADRNFAFVAEQLNNGDARGMGQRLKNTGLEATEAFLHSHSPSTLALTPTLS